MTLSVSMDQPSTNEKGTAMVAIEDKRKAESAQTGDREPSIGRYVFIGLAAFAIGVGAVWGSVTLVGEDLSPAQQAARIRGSLLPEHLDSIYESGLAQQEAIREAERLQSHIEFGLVAQTALASQRAFKEAWRMRGAEIPNHLDALVASGLAQRAAMDEE